MLKVGLIGCGFMGGMHYACYNAIDGVEVTAVSDVREEKAKELIKDANVTVYSTGIELIENADVDIIDICLPTCLHTEHAVLAMRKGRKVFIEKPVCLTVEEGKILLDVQKETGATVQVGQVIRLWDEYKWLKEITDKNEYGKIKSAVFKRLSSVPTWGWENWLHKAEMSGSVALDMHIHDYPADFPFDAGFRVKFEKATAVLDVSGVTVYYKDGGQFKPEIQPEFIGSNDIGGNLSSLGGYYNELKYFIDKVASGETPLIAPLSEGVKSAELVLSEIDSVGGAQI